MKHKLYQPKPEFIERMSFLLKDKQDLNKFFETAKTRPRKSIRVNTLKISPEELIKILKQKNWKFTQLPKHPEIIHLGLNSSRTGIISR